MVEPPCVFPELILYQLKIIIEILAAIERWCYVGVVI